VISGTPAPDRGVARLHQYQGDRGAGIPNGTRTRSPENVKARNRRISRAYAIAWCTPLHLVAQKPPQNPPQ
jgi:hypothetical protein